MASTAVVDRAGFERDTGRFRRELLAHCYRMLGSIHDAEDVVQETLLRAWRAYDRYDAKQASLRTWLYRIATNRCLTSLSGRDRRPMPSGLVGPGEDPSSWPPVLRDEVSWLQPIPDALLAPVGGDPAAIVAERGSIRLAFVAALQYLPPRQRAVLLLRDVLAWPADEVARLLETSTAAVNSMLQRARARLAKAGLAEDATEAGAADRELLDRYVTAFERSDIAALTELLRADAVMEMPPYENWYAGRDAVTAFFRGVFSRRAPGSWRCLPTRANGALAVGSYLRAGDGTFHGHAIHVCEFARGELARLTAFQDPSLFPTFDLPAVLP